MRNKKKIASIVAGAVLCASFVGAGLLVNPVNAAGETTTTMTFDTSYRTRVTTQLSNATDYKGGSISFDLYSSTLKSAKNVADAQKVGFFGAGVYTTNSYGCFGDVGYQTFDAPNVSFAFHKDSDAMGQKAWRAAKEQVNDPLYNSLTSLTYYADGRILEYTGSGTWTNARVGYLALRGPVANPNDTNFVGSADDVQAFLNEGYNYKMSWVWGHVSADKTVTTATTNSEAWYVAYRKPIATDDSKYEVLFAMKVGRPTAVTAGTGSYAGFEITANHYSNTLASDIPVADPTKNTYPCYAADPTIFQDYNSYGSVNNVQMQMDNIAIYDGYDYDTATVKAYTDFEEGWTNYEAAKEDISNLYWEDYDNNGYVYNRDRKAFKAWGGVSDNASATGFGAGPGAYIAKCLNTNAVTVDALKVQSTDAAISSIEGPSKRTVNTEVQVPVKATYTITLKEGDVTVGTLTGLDGEAVTLPATINGASYTWDQNVTSFTGNITVNGVRAKNETAVIDTSFRTRMTAPLSNAGEWLGGSIEFDLLSSSLKNAENLSKQGSVDGQSVMYGAAEITHLPKAYMDEGNNSATGTQLSEAGYKGGDGEVIDQYLGRRAAWTDFAHISFNFFKTHTNLVNEDHDYNMSWRVGAGKYNDTCENTSSFAYYADGSVVEYFGLASNYYGAYVAVRGPEYETSETFVGTREDINAFMNAGYSYKVSWVWGSVDANKNVTETNTNEEAWYVAYRKAIGAPTWEVLFAFKVQNADKVTANNGVQAGFEVQANTGMIRAAGAPSTYSNNVTMEMDNVAIYDSKVNHTATFEESVAYAETDLEVKAYPQASASYYYIRGIKVWGYLGAASEYAYLSSSEATIDGIRIQSANAGDVAIKSSAKRTYNSYDKKTITWKVDGKTIFTTEVIAGQPLTGFAQTYTYGNYTWNLGELDLTAPVTENIVINGEYTFGDDLDAMNVAVDSDVIARFYFNLTTELVNAENARMIVKVAGEDYDVVELANWAAGQDGRYAYEVKLAAAELTKKISMQFVTDAGEGIVYEYSVRDYADAMLAREATTQEQKNMIYALLNYGAAAQEYFDINTDNLANAGIENNVASVTDETIVAFKNNTLVDELSTLNVSGYELYLDYTAKMRIFFTKQVETVGIFEYTITVNGEEVEAYKLGDKYYIEIELAAAELDDTLEIVVTYNGETLTMTTSAMSYAGYAIADASAELKNVLKAMYLYCEAANVLFNA